MLGSELRRLYLEFFEAKAAKRLPSDSLVPNDPTLLFTSAGMVQFKPYFLGLQTPPAPRATTAQKCLRTTDIEDVGDTSHCTFFEMMGNFSFGDYFKAEAIAYAWEFLFDVLKLDIQNIRVTVFEDDDEAYQLWRNAGMPEEKIFRFDEHQNYWPGGAISNGPNGPCGPCSEIFFDTLAAQPPTPDGVWDDGRWLEIWNLVFMQFDRGDGGTLTPLPRRNIDTGMGLERTAAVLAGLRGPFETDLFAPILRQLESLSGLTYTSSDTDPKDVAFRRVADHVRATAFCIADGVLPSNVGRGYVLRRLMRRAILAGRRTLGLEKPFLADMMNTVIDQRLGDYPELGERRETILRYAAIEEKQFRRTLEAGTARFDALLDQKRKIQFLETAIQPVEYLSESTPFGVDNSNNQIAVGADAFADYTNTAVAFTGEEAFELHATYGFPIEMTVELALENNATVDLERYNKLWQEHLKVSEGGKTREVFATNVLFTQSAFVGRITPGPTQFVGYTSHKSKALVRFALDADGTLIYNASEGQKTKIVLSETPFYAEAGGQVGDTGWLYGEDFAFRVDDTQKSGGYYYHIGELTQGAIQITNAGPEVSAEIDSGRRASIQRNHTTTHLLHKALQQVLGAHVQQRGSLVAPDRLRFDFSHDKAMTGEEARQVEGLVNEKILDDLPIHTFEKPIAEAKDMGATMLFGEKYGDIVRVVQAGDYSLEFCGGTHLAHTSQAGLFKIVSEGSTQAGVRRIEAVTGKAALLRTLDQERLLSDIAATLKTSPLSAPALVEKLQADLKAKDKELAALQKAATGGQVERLASEAQTVNGFALVSQSLGDGVDGETLRVLAEELAQRLKSAVVILGGTKDGKVALAVRVTKDLVGRGLNAGALVKAAAAMVGGGGGGRPDAAQAGGKDPSKLAEALAEAARLAGDAKE